MGICHQNKYIFWELRKEEEVGRTRINILIFWIEEKIRSGEILYIQVKGNSNPARLIEEYKPLNLGQEINCSTSARVENSLHLHRASV